MLVPTKKKLAKIIIGTSMGTITTTMQETIAEGTTSILLVAIMASKGRTNNGTNV